MKVGVNRRAAEKIGRSLARLGHLSGTTRDDPASSREHIWRLLQQAEHPLSLEDISQATTLHVNTIRTHLDLLRAAGRVERHRGASDGRGRPRWLYAPVADDVYHQLAQDLSEALAAAEDPATAEEAAARWRLADDAALPEASTPDEAVAVAADALQRLGFDVETSPVGDAVYLGNCPYAALVTEHPSICDIHARALEQVLAGTGQDVELAALDVFPRRGVCVAHLRRKDVEPMRIVRGTAGRKGS
jgi:predicted ArsR family transcriptional regulator